MGSGVPGGPASESLHLAGTSLAGGGGGSHTNTFLGTPIHTSTVVIARIRGAAWLAGKDNLKSVREAAAGWHLGQMTRGLA